MSYAAWLFIICFFFYYLTRLYANIYVISFLYDLTQC